MGNLMWTFAIIDKHGPALESDLIKAGLRLRNYPSPEYTWRDLWIFVRHVSITSTCLVRCSPSRGWDRNNMLLADMVDGIHWLQWAQTKDGRKNRNRPEKIPRPGVTEPPRDGAKPKAAPLSAIKRKFADRHRRVSDRATKITDVFDRGR